MVQVIKLGVKRPAVRPLLPDPDPREVRYTLISVDDHLMEPPHAFEGRFPARLQDQAPRVVETEEGHQVWVLEDTPYFQVGFMAVAGRAHDDRRVEPSRFEEVRAEMRARDQRDRSRADSPLVPAEGALVLDTTGMDLERQVEAALAVIRAHPACPPLSPEPRAPGA